MTELPAATNALTGQIVDAALSIHKALGPGLLESVYQRCLAYELGLRNIRFREQVDLPFYYKTIRFDGGFRMDLVVEDSVVVEIKAIERLMPIHDAQLLTYLKLSGVQIGLLINFNVALIRSGIKRLVYTSSS